MILIVISKTDIAGYVENNKSVNRIPLVAMAIGAVSQSKRSIIIDFGEEELSIDSLLKMYSFIDDNVSSNFYYICS